jgi:multiple antibiotic resistance protein
MISETAIICLTTFFATIGPFDVAALFAALTAGASPEARRSMAVRGTLTAAVILVIFALVGGPLLKGLGISIPALRTAGGILLLLIAIEMVFARTSGGVSATREEKREAAAKEDIAVFPLATPLIAGPGTLAAVILMMAGAEGKLLLQATVIGSLLVILAFNLIALLVAGYLQNLLGVTGMNVISRVFGILLLALAVQFIFDGILQSGLFGK